MPNSITSNSDLIQGGETHSTYQLKRLTLADGIAILYGDSEILGQLLKQVNWWVVGLFVGLVGAGTHLLLLQNPSICYLYSKDQVKGFEITLPEAMATTRAWGWLGLCITPLIYLLLLSLVVWMVSRIARILGGAGGFQAHIGLFVMASVPILLGQIIGYFIINAPNVRYIGNLRDLTPGIGLGLLPWFSTERIGRFFWEVVRGFDLFGIWVLFLSTKLFRTINQFNKTKAFLIVFFCYGLFIFFRWLIEGPGYQFWSYFWTIGTGNW